MSNKTTLRTITLLPIELGEENYKTLKERFESEENTGFLDTGIETVIEFVEPIIGNVKKSEIYSAKPTHGNIDAQTSICIVREKIEEVETLEGSLSRVIEVENNYRQDLDNYTKGWQEQDFSYEGLADIPEPDSKPHMYNGVLSKLGLKNMAEETSSLDAPSFHYTFHIITCNTNELGIDDLNAAKELAYNLNLSILGKQDSTEPVTDGVDFDETFRRKVDPRIELYLLTRRSTFTILYMSAKDDDKIIKAAKAAAIRAQSVRNLCYTASKNLRPLSGREKGQELTDLSKPSESNERHSRSVKGQKALDQAEGILTRSISTTRDDLSSQILEAIIESSTIEKELQILRDQILSQKIEEEFAILDERREKEAERDRERDERDQIQQHILEKRREKEAERDRERDRILEKRREKEAERDQIQQHLLEKRREKEVERDRERDRILEKRREKEAERDQIQQHILEKRREKEAERDRERDCILEKRREEQDKRDRKQAERDRKQSLIFTIIGLVITVPTFIDLSFFDLPFSLNRLWSIVLAIAVTIVFIALFRSLLVRKPWKEKSKLFRRKSARTEVETGE